MKATIKKLYGLNRKMAKKGLEIPPTTDLLIAVDERLAKMGFLAEEIWSVNNKHGWDEASLKAIIDKSDYAVKEFVMGALLTRSWWFPTLEK